MSTVLAADIDTLLDGLMDIDTQAAEEAVFAFMRAVRSRLGLKNLAHVTGVPIPTASMWSKDPIDRNGRPARRNQPPPAAIVRLLVKFPDLSFDAFARGESSGDRVPEIATLQRELEALRREHEWTKAHHATLLIGLGHATGFDIEKLMDKAATDDPAIPRDDAPNSEVEETGA